MEKVYELNMDFWGSKKYKIKAPNPKIAMETLLHMFFSSDLIQMSNDDVNCIGIYAHDDNGKDAGSVSCMRFGNGFDVAFDGENKSQIIPYSPVS